MVAFTSSAFTNHSWINIVVSDEAIVGGFYLKFSRVKPKTELNIDVSGEVIVGGFYLKFSRVKPKKELNIVVSDEVIGGGFLSVI